MNTSEPTKTWGGARAGAGKRKRPAPARTKITIELHEKLLRTWDRLRAKRGLSRSEAIAEQVAGWGKKECKATVRRRLVVGGHFDEKGKAHPQVEWEEFEVRVMTVIGKQAIVRRPGCALFIEPLENLRFAKADSVPTNSLTKTPAAPP